MTGLSGVCLVSEREGIFKKNALFISVQERIN